MAYVALYRAYRPQKFQDVVGQEHIIKTLQNAIRLNKVAHAYLFCGPRGTGKTTLAKIMAKAMNCEKGQVIEPCCECEMCQRITKGTNPDVIEIDAASNNGADDIRALRDTVKFLPSMGQYKVYIIDEVHMLSQAAFNALLKTLEEPPSHVIFILATTEPYKLPNTILSRCQRFDFQAISIDDIVKRLKIVANEENVKITDEAIHQIAISAEGGMRDALSLFDQCISFSQNDEINIDDVLKVSGNISYLKIIELLNACISKDETNAVLLVDKIRKEIPRIINDIILFLRDLLLYKNNAILEDKIMFKNESFINLAKIVNKSVVYHWLDILNDASNQMKFSTQKRAFLELAILKMNDNEQNDMASILSRLDSLEKTVEFLSNNRPINQDFVEEKEPIFNNNPTVDISEQILQNLPKTSNFVATATKNEQFIINEPSETVATATNDEVKEITVKEIEAILNNASKSKREEINKKWNFIKDKYSNLVAVQILINGKIVACSDDSFVVELRDAGFCNRVMQYENYIKIIEIFNEFGLNIKDYICVPQNVWKQIRTDYRSKYDSQTNPKPILEDFKTGVKRRVTPKALVLDDDSKFVNDALEFFEKDEIKIVEE